eukprot:350499-Chlamydomonas_euryale.AAC.6
MPEYKDKCDICEDWYECEPHSQEKQCDKHACNCKPRPQGFREQCDRCYDPDNCYDCNKDTCECRQTREEIIPPCAALPDACIANVSSVNSICWLGGFVPCQLLFLAMKKNIAPRTRWLFAECIALNGTMAVPNVAKGGKKSCEWSVAWGGGQVLTCYQFPRENHTTWECQGARGTEVAGVGALPHIQARRNYFTTV